MRWNVSHLRGVAGRGGGPDGGRHPAFVKAVEGAEDSQTMGEEDLKEIEAAANRAIEEDVPFEILYPTKRGAVFQWSTGAKRRSTDR